MAGLLDAQIEAGFHACRWDGRDDRGMPVAAGVYVLRLDKPQASVTQRVVWLR